MKIMSAIGMGRKYAGCVIGLCFIIIPIIALLINDPWGVSWAPYYEIWYDNFKPLYNGVIYKPIGIAIGSSCVGIGILLMSMCKINKRKPGGQG